MLNQILEYTKKFYPYSLETGVFTIVADGIEGFTGEYVVGQYINIQESFLNDGTYKITAVTDTKLTLDATLTAEDTATIYLWGLKLPKAYLSLISDIETYADMQTTSANLQSESQGNRSVTYKDGSDWQSAFKAQLSVYRSLYDDRATYCRMYNIDTKGW